LRLHPGLIRQLLPSASRQLLQQSQRFIRHPRKAAATPSDVDIGKHAPKRRDSAQARIAR